MRQNRYVDSNEAPSAADAAYVEQTYDSKLAEWRRRGLVWWTNTNRTTAEIPDEVFSVLCDLIQNQIASAFEAAPGPPQTQQLEEVLLGNLRRLMHKPPSGEATPFSPY